MANERDMRRTVKVEKIGPERVNGDTTEQDVIKVTVYYSKGGVNYFHGNTDPRGYWISVSPVTISVRKGSPFVSEIGMMMAGRRKFVREASRFSAKTLDEVAEQAKVSNELLDAMRATVLAEKTLPSQQQPKPEPQPAPEPAAT